MELQPMPEGVRPNIEHTLQTKGAESPTSPLLFVGIAVFVVMVVFAIGWYYRKRH